MTYQPRGVVNDLNQAYREFQSVQNTLRIEPWNLVGSTHKTKFSNGFVNWNSGTNRTAAGYRQDGMGRVYLKGFVTKGSSPGVGVDIFFLPQAYRPVKDIGFICLASDGSTTGPVRIEIRANDGGVEFLEDLSLTWNTTENTSWLELTHITFFTDTD